MPTKALRILVACLGFALLPVPSLRAEAAPDVKSEILALERQMETALTGGNPERFGEYLAPDWKGIDLEGNLLTKERLMQTLQSNRLKLQSYKVVDMDVRIYGESVIVTGTDQTKGTWDDEAFENVDRFTDVFAKVGGKWMLVSTHITRMPKPGQ